MQRGGAPKTEGTVCVGDHLKVFFGFSYHVKFTNWLIFRGWESFIDPMAPGHLSDLRPMFWEVSGWAGRLGGGFWVFCSQRE